MALIVLVFLGCLANLRSQSTPTNASIDVELAPGMIGTISFSYTFGKAGDKRDPADRNTVFLQQPGKVALLVRNYKFLGFRDAKSLKTTLIFPPGLPMEGPSSLSLQEAADQEFVFFTVKDSLSFPSPLRVYIDYNGERLDATYSIKEKLKVAGLPSSPSVPSTAPAAAPPTTPSRETPTTEEVKGDEEPLDEAVAASAREIDDYIAANADAPKKLEEYLRRIDIEPSQTTIGDRTTFLLSRLTDLEVVDLEDSEKLEVVKSRKTGPTTHELVVAVKSAGSFKVVVRDPSKSEDIFPLTLRAGSDLDGTFEQAVDSVRFFDLVGGLPPYSLAFFDEQEQLLRLDSIPPSGITLSLDSLSARMPEGGILRVVMVDSRTTGNFTFGGEAIRVSAAKAPPGNLRVYLLILAVLLALGAFQLFRVSRKKRNLDEIRDRLAENDDHRLPPVRPIDVRPEAESAASPEETAILAGFTPPKEVPEVEQPEVPEGIGQRLSEQTAPASASAEPTDEDKVETVPSGEESINVPPPVAAGPKPKRRIKITRRRGLSESEQPPFRPDLNPENYLSLPLETHWPTSMVDTILLSKSAIRKLDDFLRQENTSKIAASYTDREQRGWERNEAVPEIGGMLLGQRIRDPETNTYRVSLEEFVPLEAKSQSIVRVEIDPLSLARDLSRAQDENPDLAVVSWFHTHPGHGLFLSRPDLKIQYGHFRKPWHIAMEIDSLSARLDTAFFSYKPSGHMNNSNSLRPDTPWFSWNEIEEFARR